MEKGLLREKQNVFPLKLYFPDCEGRGDSEPAASVIRGNQTGFPYEEECQRHDDPRGGAIFESQRTFAIILPNTIHGCKKKDL